MNKLEKMVALKHRERLGKVVSQTNTDNVHDVHHYLSAPHADKPFDEMEARKLSGKIVDDFERLYDELVVTNTLLDALLEN